MKSPLDSFQATLPIANDLLNIDQSYRQKRKKKTISLTVKRERYCDREKFFSLSLPTEIYIWRRYPSNNQ